MTTFNPRDSHKTALYTAERGLAATPDLAPLGQPVTQAEARRLIYATLDFFGVPRGFLTGGVRFSARAKRRCWYNGNDKAGREIVFAPFGLEKAYISVHEAVHAVMDWHGLMLVTPFHGREFARLAARGYAAVLMGGQPDLRPDSLRSSGAEHAIARSLLVSGVPVARPEFDPAKVPGIVFEARFPSVTYRLRATHEAHVRRMLSKYRPAVVEAAAFAPTSPF